MAQSNVIAREHRALIGMETTFGTTPAGSYPEVMIADWATYARDRAEWFAPDGIHLRPLGTYAAADVHRPNGLMENGQPKVPERDYFPRAQAEVIERMAKAGLI